MTKIDAPSLNDLENRILFLVSFRVSASCIIITASTAVGAASNHDGWHY